MPSFYPPPLDVKRELVDYFAVQPIGTKIKYGFHLSVSNGASYELKNSYIKLEKGIYALG